MRAFKFYEIIYFGISQFLGMWQRGFLDLEGEADDMSQLEVRKQESLYVWKHVLQRILIKS